MDNASYYTEQFAGIVSFTNFHQLTLKYLASLNLRSLNLYGTLLDHG